MDYMVAKFIWYVLLAFTLGAWVGWYFCGKSDGE